MYYCSVDWRDIVACFPGDDFSCSLVYVFQIYKQRPQPGKGGTLRRGSMLHCKQVAPKYGVTPKTIRDVWSGRSWAEATRPFWTEDEKNRRNANEEDSKHSLERNGMVCIFYFLFVFKWVSCGPKPRTVPIFYLSRTTFCALRCCPGGTCSCRLAHCIREWATFALTPFIKRPQNHSFQHFRAGGAHFNTDIHTNTQPQGMHPDDPSRMTVPYHYMPGMGSCGMVGGHMLNWGGAPGANGGFQPPTYMPSVALANMGKF